VTAEIPGVKGARPDLVGEKPAKRRDLVAPVVPRPLFVLGGNPGERLGELEHALADSRVFDPVIGADQFEGFALDQGIALDLLLILIAQARLEAPGVGFEFARYFFEEIRTPARRESC